MINSQLLNSQLPKRLYWSFMTLVTALAFEHVVTALSSVTARERTTEVVLGVGSWALGIGM